MTHSHALSLSTLRIVLQKSWPCRHHFTQFRKPLVPRIADTQHNASHQSLRSHKLRVQTSFRLLLYTALTLCTFCTTCVLGLLPSPLLAGPLLSLPLSPSSLFRSLFFFGADFGSAGCPLELSIPLSSSAALFFVRPCQSLSLFNSPPPILPSSWSSAPALSTQNILPSQPYATLFGSEILPLPSSS